MGVEDPWVRVVDDRRFDSPREQRVRLSSEELVERVLARDEHREAAPTTTRAAPLLPQRRDRAGEADRDRTVEEADVDPQLECVRCGHAQQVALDEAALDLTTLLGRVAGSVGGETARRRECRPARP